MIRVQTDDFSLQAEYDALSRDHDTGAIVTFIGTVREFSGAKQSPFYLQHYPGMTETVLENIENEARTRWPLNRTVIIHRVGQLALNDQIVLVGASSPHREDAFLAAEFMIDTLKTEAPFWKKEGDHWVNAKHSDSLKVARWLQP